MPAAAAAKSAVDVQVSRHSNTDTRHLKPDIIRIYVRKEYADLDE